VLFVSGFLFSCSSDSSENDVEVLDGIEEAVENKISYDSLKSSCEFVGRWKMEWTFSSMESQKPVVIEYYHTNSDNEYYQVWIENTLSISRLIRDGDRYLGIQKGDYSIISESGELESYDDEGLIGEEFGFKHTKM